MIRLQYSSETKPKMIPPLPFGFVWVPQYPIQHPWYQLEDGTWRADAIPREYLNQHLNQLKTETVATQPVIPKTDSIATH